jgi:acyl-CoA synthetase (NDP forming)/GNAT superfamily N-acetyltransferase
MQEVPAGYDVLAADGAVLQVRVVGPGDVPCLRQLFVRLSARTAYQRFLSASPVAGDEYVDSLDDPERTLDAVLAVRQGVVVGVGSSHEVNASTAEVALVVDDVSRGHGLGTLLLEDLVARARARGLLELVALVLCRNLQMLQVFHDLGLPLRTERDGDTLSVTVDLGEAPALETALAAREAAAAAASMERMLRPRSVAVLGPSGHRKDIAQQMVRRLRRSGFGGTVRAVNGLGPGGPHAPDRQDPGAGVVPVDLAVVAVAPGDDGAAARSCVGAGAGALAVLGTPPGARTTGAAGAAGAVADVAGLRRLCRDAGIRVLGPGSLGLVNTDPATGVDLTLLHRHARAGAVGVVSDSAPVTAKVLAALHSQGVGVSALLDTGLGADVGPCDLLAFASVDARTAVAAVCLHAVTDVAALTRAVRTAALPVLLLAGDGLDGDGLDRDELYRNGGGDGIGAWCRSIGVTRVGSAKELADTAALLVGQPVPGGRRVAVLGNDRDAGERARRRCSVAGLLPPDLTQHTEARLRLLLPAAASVTGVVDTTGSASPEQLRLALGTLAEDPGVDAVVVLLEPRFHLGPAAIQSLLERASAAARRTTFISGTPLGAGRSARTVPCADGPEAAVTALAHVVAQRRRLRPASIQPADLPRPAMHRLAGLVVAEAMRDRPAGGWLSRRDADEVLRAYGVEVVPTVGADGPETAAEASTVLPFPVVLTAYGAGRAGGPGGPGGAASPQAAAVATLLRSPAEVRLAARELRDRLGEDVHDFGLQPQLHQGPSLAVLGGSGTGWGPVVGLALAEESGSHRPDGTWADGSPQDLSDARRPRWALAPVDGAQAIALVRDVRMACGLAGSVLWPAAALASLTDVVVRVSVLLHDLAEVAEVELRPVVLDGDHALVAAARVRLQPPRARDHPPLLRRLHG